MSTFFEKLTGARTPTAPQSTTAEPSAEETPRPTRRQSSSSTGGGQKSLRTAKEETETPSSSAEAIPEEEGELTVDIYDAGDTIVIQSTVAGVKPEDLDVTISDDTITIRGRREQQGNVAEDNYYYKEVFWGSFSRTIILPEEIEKDAAEAALKHGLLTITLPKKRRGATQKLKVRNT